MPTSRTYDVAVIGAGPGGYSAAIRAAQLGKSAAVIERDNVGGVCLNWGCIPTKALIKNAEVLDLVHRAKEFGISIDNYTVDFSAAVTRSRRVSGKLTKGVEYLLKKNAVEHIKGEARFLGPQQVGVFDADGEQIATVQATNYIIATGSHPKSIPGVEIDGRLVISSTEAMLLQELPESMIILGGGAVGIEFAYVFNMYGVHVTIVEMLPNLLPGADAEICKLLKRSFTKRKMDLRTGWMVESVKTGNGSVAVSVSKDGQIDELQAGMVLMGIGRGANIDGLGLDAVGVTVERGFIPVDGYCRGNVEHIYAIGDVNGPPLLAHTAVTEGIIAAEHLAGRDPKPFDPLNVPSCVYCQPQIASIGLTEEQAREANHEVKIGRSPFQANGRAQAEGDYEGMVKLITDAGSGAILGAHIIGHGATELIAELGVVKSWGMPVDKVAHTIHAHPTLSESLMEAALSVTGEAINI